MIILAIEDDLSEWVARKLLCEAGYDNSEIRCTGKRGFGALQAKLGDLVAASRRFLVLLLVDLDLRACAPALVSSWLGKREVPRTFLFRVAVREIEAWLLADREAFAEFIGVPESRIERNTEEIADPKRKLLDLARRGKRRIRAGLIPSPGAAASQGDQYNELLCEFVDSGWSSERAANHNASLRKTITALANRHSVDFVP